MDGVDPINKKNSKLETFLKRNLDSDAYDRIRYHESCIVLSDKQPKLDKALCYVVVGHDFIYLTENPPKTIRGEAPYRNVLNIELKNDFPYFIGGKEERANTLHIAITHLVEDASKSKKAKKSDSDNLERSSSLPTQLDPYGRSDSAISPSNLLTPRAGGSSPNLPRKSSETSPHLVRRSCSSTEQSATDTQKLKHSGSWDEDKFLRSFDNDLNLASIQSPQLANSAPNHELRPPDRLVVPRNGALCTPRPRAHKRTDSDQSETSSSGSSSELKGLNQRKVSSVSEDGAGTPRPLPSPSFQRKMPLHTAASVPNDLVLLGDKKGKQKKGKDKSKMKSEDEFIAEVSEETKSDVDIVVTSTEPEYPGMRKCTSDIYMMAYNSPVLTFMKNAWDNYKIRGTLLEDPVFEANHNSKKTPGEKLDALYGQLKQEILSSGNSMEELFSLIHELKVASERNFVIKKLFWKSSDLFQFMVQQLQCYLPSSPANMSTDDGKNQRADEFELVNLILEALAFMFRETENLTTRSTCLKQQKGKVVIELLLLLTCTPETPKRHKPKMSRAAALLLMTPNDQRNAVADSELNKLVADFTNQTTTLLFELIVVAQQNREKDGINLNFLMKTLEESESTEMFVKRIIAIAMHLLSPSTKAELLPNEAVLLYQQFSVLATLMMYSATLCKSIRDNYFEEFKYYIQAPVIMNKLPNHFPITKPTLAVMEKVISKVLQKEFKFTMVPRKKSSQSVKL